MRGGCRGLGRGKNPDEGEELRLKGWGGFGILGDKLEAAEAEGRLHGAPYPEFWNQRSGT